MITFKCKMCGGTMNIDENSTTVACEYCGTSQTLPKLNDEKKRNLFDRANHFRRNNDFDKATEIYEKILNEDSSDAEAFWSLVLCRYGIQYVEDPATHARIPTVNRMQYTSIFADENYKSAIAKADISQKIIYEKEAKAIDDIQKNILSLVKNEKPFDVFICYKETDSNGQRTRDSVLANDLYHQLTQEGFKVFFARITLEDKLGTAYEPYIFAALNSAKVMVVLGTKPEFFRAVWVKNEWSRYLALVAQSNGQKTLIPAYKDMDPYDLPEEFSHLQAQDMSKLGFMQDLIRGIKKLVPQNNSENHQNKAYQNEGVNISLDALLKRAKLFLQSGEWTKAQEYCDKVLDNDAENETAYLYQLLAKYHCSTLQELKNVDCRLRNQKDYKVLRQFCSQKLGDELDQIAKEVDKKLDIIEQKKRKEAEREQRRQKEVARQVEKIKCEKEIADIEKQIEYKQTQIKIAKNKSIELEENKSKTKKYAIVMVFSAVLSVILVITSSTILESTNGDMAVLPLLALYATIGLNATMTYKIAKMSGKSNIIISVILSIMLICPYWLVVGIRTLSKNPIDALIVQNQNASKVMENELKQLENSLNSKRTDLDRL